MSRLRREARRRRTSIAAVVRDAVEAQLSAGDWEARTQRALQAIRQPHRSGLVDVSERHDEFLVEDLLA